MYSALCESTKFLILDYDTHRDFIDTFILIWSKYKILWKRKVGRPTGSKTINTNDVFFDSMYDDKFSTSFTIRHTATVYIYSQERKRIHSLTFINAEECVRLLLLMFIDLNCIYSELQHFIELKPEYLYEKNTNEFIDVDKFSEWRNKITSITQIPESIVRSMFFFNVDPEIYFENIDSSEDNIYIMQFRKQVVNDSNYNNIDKLQTIDKIITKTSLETNIDLLSTEDIHNNSKRRKVDKKVTIRKDGKKKVNHRLKKWLGVEDGNTTSSFDEENEYSDEEEDDDDQIEYDEEFDLYTETSSLQSSFSNISGDSSDSFFDSASAMDSIILNKMNGIFINTEEKKDTRQAVEFYSIHGYTLSAVVFTFCMVVYNSLQYKKYTNIDEFEDVTLLTMYRYSKYYINSGGDMKDCGDIRSSIPIRLRDRLNTILKNILEYVKFRYDNDIIVDDCSEYNKHDIIFRQIGCLFNYYSNIHSKIELQRDEEYKKLNFQKRTLRKYKLLDKYHNLLDFFDVVDETPIVSTNMLDNDYKKLVKIRMPTLRERGTYYLMVFSKLDVSVADVYKSFLIMIRKFKGDEIKYNKFTKNTHEYGASASGYEWDIIFSQSFVCILLPKSLYLDLTRFYIPSIVSNARLTKRNVRVPMFYVHIHNYYYGGSKGLLMSMKNLLKCFQSYHRESYQSLNTGLPVTEADPIVKFYSIFYLIIERYQSCANIWNQLTKPYQDARFFYTKKSNKTKKDTIVGFTDLLPNIYTSIKSFILVYERHLILYSTLLELYEEFKENEKLRENFSGCFKLCHSLIHDEEKQAIYISNISSDKFIYVTMDNLNENEKKHIFPYVDASPVVLLYFVCTSHLIRDSLAVKIFASIITNPQINKHTKSSIISQKNINQVLHTLPRFSSKYATKNLDKLKNITNIMDDNIDVWLENQTFLNKSKNIIEHESNNNVNSKHMEAFVYLFRSIEELSNYSIECNLDAPQFYRKEKYFRGNPDKPIGFLKVNAQEITSCGPDKFPHIPIDMDYIPSQIEKITKNKPIPNGIIDGKRLQFVQTSLMSNMENQKNNRLITTITQHIPDETKERIKQMETPIEIQKRDIYDTFNSTLYFIDNCIPIWESEMSPVTFDNSKLRRKTNHKILRPLTGSDDLFLDCILFSPIRDVLIKTGGAKRTRHVFEDSNSEDDNDDSDFDSPPSPILSTKYDSNHTYDNSGWISKSRKINF